MKIWEVILFLAAVLITGTAMAAQFTTTTGQGYFTWNGQVISYYSFNQNSTFNLVDGVTATDTSGVPNEIINQQAEKAYICSQNGNQTGC